MGFSDVHIKALEKAHVCVGLGARLRNISALTGLPTWELRRHGIAELHKTPRGRPPGSIDWYFTTELCNRAEASVVTERYWHLSRNGFLPSDALIAAYQHYLRLVELRPRVSFDRAFDLASLLDGRWVASQATLEIRPCATCDCAYLATKGDTNSSGCPFCKILRRLTTATGACYPEAPEVQDDLSGQPVRSQKVRSLQLAQRCVALGAGVRTCSLLSGLSLDHLNHLFYRDRTRSHHGRAPESSAWLSYATIAEQVHASVFAGHYSQLLALGFDPSSALLSAYGHYATLYGPAKKLSLDRAFGLAAHIGGHWIVDKPSLRLHSCSRCGCEHLTQSRARASEACPFCKLQRQHSIDGRVRAAFPARHLAGNSPS